MKKLLLSFLSLFLIAGVALAEDSYTVTFKSNSTNSDGSEITVYTPSSYISDGVEYIQSVNEKSKIYLGKNGKGLKFGSGSAVGKLDLGIADKDTETLKNGQVKATKIVVSATQYNTSDGGKLKVSVNGKELGQASLNGEITDYTFDAKLGTDEVLETIKFETTQKRCYLVSFTVYYGEADTREDVTLSFPETEYVATLGEAFEAPVVSGAPEGAEIVYTSSDEAVATVAANGAVTLVGEGTTTITAAFDGNDAYKPAKPVEYTLTVIDPNAPISLWKLVTDVNELNEGDVVTIACNTKGTVMTNNNVGNYRDQKDVTFYCNNNYIAEDADIMQLELGKNGNNWTFKTLNYNGTNGYIGNKASSNNCTISSSMDTGYAAAVTIAADGNASIIFNNSNSNKYLTYNATSPRFACYGNTNQTAVQIYKLIKVDQPIEAPVAEVALNDVVLVSEYGFDIMYAVTDSEGNVPTDFEEYNEAIVLKNLAQGNNYIWAKAVVGPYESEAECIHVYENVDAEEVACTYKHNGVTPEDNCWVVIGAEVNGKHYFMGPDGKATLATVVNNEFAGYASHFDNTVNEYRHVGGNLTIKPVAAKVAARAAVSEGLTLAVDNNGVATVTNGEGTLGFDAEKKVFSADADNKALKVFATEGDVNTGIDNVAADSENAPVEYYNMQGVRVENPAKGGLYIKRQGAEVTKVAL